VPSTTNDYLYRLFRKIGLSDFGAQTADAVIRGPVEILLILLACVAVSRFGARVVRRSVQGVVARSSAKRGDTAHLAKRAETLSGVAASLVRVAVWTIGVLLVIDKLGVNPGPALAGASIVGVAVGFGAQSLVRDFLSGFFVLAEDQFGVGDLITVSDVTGTVEDVNLRVTRLRSNDGTVWYVPNGEMRKVGNAAKEWSRAIVDVTIPVAADLAAAIAAISDEVQALAADPVWGELVVEAPEVLGVESIAVDGFTVRVQVKTQPAAHGRVARELRARVGARLYRDGIVPVRTAAAAPPTSPPPDADGREESAGQT
jgi:small-conductance mechanosensitive channel